MAKFDINKKGYDCEQVDSFISKLSLKYEEKLSEQKDRVFALKNELSIMEQRLSTYKDKDKQISQALIYAVEKAEQIENNASKLYDLEVKRMRLLYKQWEEMLIKLEGCSLDSSTKKELNMFKKTIDEVLAQNQRIGSTVIRQDLHNNGTGYIRNLLNRMDYAINSKAKPQETKAVVQEMAVETEKENNRAFNISNKLDKIKVKGSGNMAENYLNSDETDNSAFASAIIKKGKTKSQDSGFNIEEALNPTEDLDEIMKAFDFFLEAHKDD
ncbi:MAG: hypothetical protein E7354_04865 [Clostridiales bacterium]|nr:hypothetical protein [Clostridiales bacterium]